LNINVVLTDHENKRVLFLTLRKEHWKAFEHTAVAKVSKYKRVYYGN